MDSYQSMPDTYRPESEGETPCTACMRHRSLCIATRAAYVANTVPTPPWMRTKVARSDFIGSGQRPGGRCRVLFVDLTDQEVRSIGC